MTSFGNIHHQQMIYRSDRYFEVTSEVGEQKPGVSPLHGSIGMSGLVLGNVIHAAR